MKKIFRHKILVFGVLLVFIITIMMPTINGNLSQIKDIQKNFNKKESNLETIGGSDYWLQTTDEDFNSGTKTNIVVQNDEFFLDKTFREFTLIDNESFENEWPPNNWVENGYWNKESDQVHTGSYSADIDGWLFPAGGNLITYSMDCALENIIEIYVSFWGYDEGSDLGEYYLDYYDGNEWDEIIRLDNFGEGNWAFYSDTITDPQYFISDFKIRWRINSLDLGEHCYVDDVKVSYKQEVYVEDGNLISQTHDTGKITPIYSGFLLNSNIPTGTSVNKLIRVADTESELQSAEWHPNISKLPNKRWVQWKIELNGNGINTPTIYDVNVTWTFSGNDTEPPYVKIIQPEVGFLYINIGEIEFKILIRLPFFPVFVIGKLNVEVEAFDNQSDISKIEFYVDDDLKKEIFNKPYEWSWEDHVVFFPYTIKVIAYDLSGNQNNDEIKIFKIY